MFQEAYKRLNPEGQSQKSIGCRQSCVILFLPMLLLYLSYGVFLIVPNGVNRIKWLIRGSANYQFTISKYGLLPPDIQIGRKVVVKNGEIATVSNVSLNEPVYVSDIGTIETMFNNVYSCSLFFPLFICSFNYDSFYGYPASIVVNCPIPDACYTAVEVRDMVILPP